MRRYKIIDGMVTVNNRLKFEVEIVHDLSCHLYIGFSDSQGSVATHLR